MVRLDYERKKDEKRTQGEETRRLGKRKEMEGI